MDGRAVIESPADFLRRMAPTQSHEGRRSFIAAAHALDHPLAPRPGEVHPVDEAFYKLAIVQRDGAWREVEQLKKELDDRS